MKISSWVPVMGLVALVLFGCATPYQKVGTDETGGHSFRQLATDVFEVKFQANGFTPAKRAQDFAMLRAAEICLEHNYRYFAVLGEEDASHTETAYVGGYSTTTGTVNRYGGTSTFTGTTYSSPQAIPIYKPGSVITIRCFSAPPGGHAGLVQDARAVASSVRAKYGIK